MPKFGQIWPFWAEINFKPFLLNPLRPENIPEMAILEGQFYSLHIARRTGPNFDD